jgi:hypothetical protein
MEKFWAPNREIQRPTVPWSLSTYLERRLDVDTLFYIVYILVEIYDVLVDGFEEKPEAFEDLQIVVLELFIKLRKDLKCTIEKQMHHIRGLI